MARRKAERPAERGVRRAETNAVAAYLTALRAPTVPARSRANLERRRAQVEEWLRDESSPIREVELIQRRLDIDAQLAQTEQAQRLAELEEAFVKVATSWANRNGISAAALREVGVPASVLRRAGLDPPQVRRANTGARRLAAGGWECSRGRFVLQRVEIHRFASPGSVATLRLSASLPNSPDRVLRTSWAPTGAFGRGLLDGAERPGASSVSNCWTRPSMSSRIRRTTSTGWPAGSSSSQSR
jgi:hypothetical protein